MSLVHARKPNSYLFNDGSTGQGHSRYGDSRSSRAGIPPMSNYNDDWPPNPNYHQDALYQEKSGWPSDVGFHRDRGDHGSFSGPFHPRAAGYPRYDSGASGWHQTPGMSSGSGSLFPQCGSPSYGQGAMADEWGGPKGRDPYSQAQRRLHCSSCGFGTTTAPYFQPGGTGPMSPADDFYNDRPFDSFSNRHSRAADWQQNPGGGFDTQFDDMAYPRSNSPMGTYGHRQQQHWNQGPSGAYDFQDPYSMMGGDPYDRGLGNQGFSVGGGDPYGFPGMGMSGMSGTSRRGIHSTPHPRNNLLTSYHYSKRVYVRDNSGGMGSRPYGGY